MFMNSFSKINFTLNVLVFLFFWILSYRNFILIWCLFFDLHIFLQNHKNHNQKYFFLTTKNNSSVLTQRTFSLNGKLFVFASVVIIFESIFLYDIFMIFVKSLFLVYLIRIN